MQLDINFIVVERANSVSLEFDIINKPKDFGESIHNRPEGYETCFSYGWLGRGPGFVSGEEIDTLYEPAAKKLADFIKLKSEESPFVHFTLKSILDPVYSGRYVSGTAFKKRFARPLNADELRKMGDGLKKALEGK